MDVPAKSPVTSPMTLFAVKDVFAEAAMYNIRVGLQNVWQQPGSRRREDPLIRACCRRSG